MQFVVQKPVAESGALCDFEFLAVRLLVVIVSQPWASVPGCRKLQMTA